MLWECNGSKLARRALKNGGSRGAWLTRLLAERALRIVSSGPAG